MLATENLGLINLAANPVSQSVLLLSGVFLITTITITIKSYYVDPLPINFDSRSVAHELSSAWSAAL